jgi:hypothetical protein
LKKAVRITAGFVLLAAGLILAIPGIPGPGIALAAGGLLLLADHFEWAHRLLTWGRLQLARIRNR